MTILKNRCQKLYAISAEMVENGILRIPNGITEIDGNLDLMLENANFEIKAVIFPSSLERIDNFFYNNKSVKLVVFNSPVTLTSNYAQGTFENSNVEKVFIRHGFKEVANTRFPGQLIREDQLFPVSKLDISEDEPNLCLSFYNSNIESLIIGCGEYNGPKIPYIYSIEKSHSKDYPGVPYHQISYIAYNDKSMKIYVLDVNATYLPMDRFDSEVAEAIKQMVDPKRLSFTNNRLTMGSLLSTTIK